MAWALINNVQMTVGMWVSVGEDDQKRQVFENVVCEPGTIINLIAYDGISPYSPPSDCHLIQVPDNVKVGDTGY